MDRHERRDTLRLLDSYLEALETVQARGAQVVPTHLMNGLQRDVMGVVPGLSVSETIEIIFRQQERYMTVERGNDSPAEQTTTEIELPKQRARLLTDTIKKQLRGDVSLLLSTAHKLRAWAALNYASWEEYVRLEFGLSRRRSYELLDHADVILTIRDAGHVQRIPHLRPFTASQLKPHLEEICQVLLASTSNLEPAAAQQVVDSVIDEWRARCALERATRREAPPVRRTALDLDVTAAGDSHFGAGDVARLTDAILYLSRLPELDVDTARALPLAETVRLTALPAAVSWLSNLNHAVAELSPRIVAIR